MSSRKHTSKTMPTKKAPRKETGRLPKKSSMASSAAAAKRDPAVTVPPPPKEMVKQQDSSLFFLTQSAKSKAYPKRSNTEAIGVGTTAPIPSKQKVTRLWSKGAVVKQIHAVQDESATPPPPPPQYGYGVANLHPNWMQPLLQPSHPPILLQPLHQH